jgi:hypothetical protein
MFNKRFGADADTPGHPDFLELRECNKESNRLQKEFHEKDVNPHMGESICLIDWPLSSYGEKERTISAYRQLYRDQHVKIDRRYFDHFQQALSEGNEAGRSSLERMKESDIDMVCRIAQKLRELRDLVTKELDPNYD